MGSSSPCIVYRLEPVRIVTYNCFKVIRPIENRLMKRKSIDKAVVSQTQVALRNILDLFESGTRDLLFYLYKEHGVPVYDPENLSPKKIGSAFASLFGRGGDILFERFDAEFRNDR